MDHSLWTCMRHGWQLNLVSGRSCSVPECAWGSPELSTALCESCRPSAGARVGGVEELAHRPSGTSPDDPMLDSTLPCRRRLHTMLVGRHYMPLRSSISKRPDGRLVVSQRPRTGVAAAATPKDGSGGEVVSRPRTPFMCGF